MSFLAWLRGHMSPQYRATSVYRRGIVRAKAGRHQAAIEDYTEVLQMPNVEPSISAMARYNRALAYSAIAEETKAIDDLQAILTASEATEHVKTEARRKLLRMDRSSARTSIMNVATGEQNTQ